MEVRGPVIFVFLMCCIFGHINDFVEAKKSFSKFEDLEIEERLKTINKPAVRIIKTIDGEKYGCVDFFKQPAFDHPSMKNHTYHYKMRPIWKGMRERKTNGSGFGYLWENGVGCPVGTVPIRRVTKDDLLRLDLVGDDHKPHGSWNTTAYGPNSPPHLDQNHYAVARTKDPGQRFHGATMQLCVAAPKVKPTQYSASRLHIQIGNDFIQAGITVNPILYKDYKPRTFVYTNSGGQSCYNSNCNVGIIGVRQDFPLGTALLPSIRGAKSTRYLTVGLIKDQINGNWWLQVSDKAEEIGFWPASRFHQSFGNNIEWGGEVYSASQPGPEMGFGHYPGGDLSSDAYMKRISVLDANYKVDRAVHNLELYFDNPRGLGYLSRDYPQLPNYPMEGHVIFFGGPGFK